MYISDKLSGSELLRLNYPPKNITLNYHFEGIPNLHMSIHVSKCFTLKFARVTRSIDKKKITLLLKEQKKIASDLINFPIDYEINI